MGEGWFVPCELYEFAVIGVLVSCAPVTPASLQHPESYHVLQKSRRAIYFVFVCKVQLEGLRRHNGCVEFSTDQRSGSRTEECSAIASCNRSNGRTGVMACRSDYRCSRQRRVLRYRRLQSSNDCAGLDDLCCELRT